MNHPQLNHKVEVVSGLLADECGALLTEFFRSRRAKLSDAQSASE
jgi:tRNA(adenine34) deaminase